VAQERRYLLTIGDTTIFIFMSWACPRFTSTKNFVKFLLQNLVVQRLPPRRPSGPFLLISIYSKFGTLPGLRKSCGCKASPRKEGREKRRQGEVKRTGKKINDIKWLAIDIKHLMRSQKFFGMFCGVNRRGVTMKSKNMVIALLAFVVLGYVSYILFLR
jgi:hypothetical protein